MASPWRWILGVAGAAWVLRPRDAAASSAPGTGSLSFASLAPGYRDRYQRAQILPARLATATSRARNIETSANRERYHAVGDPLGVPWYVVGMIHQLEASGRFTAHLHNGDALTARTTHVPRGRPTTGAPPFTWEESATDALRSQGMATWRDWSIAGICYQLEKFNGFGYRQHNVPTPYLWSFTDQYVMGKFVADGVWNSTAVSAQCGAVPMLRQLVALGLIEAPPL